MRTKISPSCERYISWGLETKPWFTVGKCHFLWREAVFNLHELHFEARWAPTSYKWVITPISRVITPLTHVFSANYRGYFTPFLNWWRGLTLQDISSNILFKILPRSTSFEAQAAKNLNDENWREFVRKSTETMHKQDDSMNSMTDVSVFCCWKIRYCVGTSKLATCS